MAVLLGQDGEAAGVRVAEEAARRGVEAEEAARRGVEAEPADGQHAGEVTVRHHGDVSRVQQRADPFQYGIDPRRHPLQPLPRVLRVAGNEPVPPQLPARPTRADTRGRQPLVPAVVPLQQVGIGPGSGQTREPGRAHRAAERAAEHRDGSRAVRQPGPESARRRLPRLRQRHVRTARIPSGAAPLRLPVPDHDQFPHAGRR
ncbi:putative alpha-ribazole phosphatase [Streptomyces sp. Tu6071]|nr:putative alpha-ribazole phosphatase [Streptomyces sp. Tu6071]